MIVITLLSTGVNNTPVTRRIMTDSLDFTSVPSAEIINGRQLNLFDCPEKVAPKVWKRMHKQARLEYLWDTLKRNKRIHITVSMLAEALGAISFKWYEV